MEAGWLDRQLKKATKDAESWPTWLRQEAGLEPKAQARSDDAGKDEAESVPESPREANQVD